MSGLKLLSLEISPLCFIAAVGKPKPDSSQRCTIKNKGQCYKLQEKFCLDIKREKKKSQEFKSVTKITANGTLTAAAQLWLCQYSMIWKTKKYR